jgi:hypothetical protein
VTSPADTSREGGRTAFSATDDNENRDYQRD